MALRNKTGTLDHFHERPRHAYWAWLPQTTRSRKHVPIQAILSRTRLPKVSPALNCHVGRDIIPVCASQDQPYNRRQKDSPVSQGQAAYTLGDRHVYASRTRSIPTTLPPLLTTKAGRLCRPRLAAKDLRLAPRLISRRECAASGRVVGGKPIFRCGVSPAAPPAYRATAARTAFTRLAVPFPAA